MKKTKILKNNFNKEEPGKNLAQMNILELFLDRMNEQGERRTFK